jgi:hypothetical protein
MVMGAVAAQPGFEGTVRTGNRRRPVQSVLLDRPAFISRDDAVDNAKNDIGEPLPQGSADTAPMLSAVREGHDAYTLVYTWLARITQTGEAAQQTDPEAFLMAATIEVVEPFDTPVLEKYHSERAAEDAERTSMRLESAPLTQRDEETDEEYAARRKRVEKEPGSRFSPENLFPGEEAGVSAPYEVGLTGAVVNSTVVINFKNYGKTLVEDVVDDNDARVSFLSRGRGTYTRENLGDASGGVSSAAFAAIRTVVQDAFTYGYIPDGRAQIEYTTPGDYHETRGRREKVYVAFGRRLYSMLNGITGSISQSGTVSISVDSRVNLRSDPAAIHSWNLIPRRCGRSRNGRLRLSRSVSVSFELIGFGVKLMSRGRFSVRVGKLVRTALFTTQGPAFRRPALMGTSPDGQTPTALPSRKTPKCGDWKTRLALRSGTYQPRAALSAVPLSNIITFTALGTRIPRLKRRRGE